MRYWFASCGILDEARRLEWPPVVVDLGCERGVLKSLCAAWPKMRWIGLDLDTSHPRLAKAGYDETYACDFDQPLPLPPHSADIVICLHVFEHLPRPAFTLGEIRRILQPGGILLAGTPTAPNWVAYLRERQFARALAAGRRPKGSHIHCLSPGRLRKLTRREGLVVEFMCGSHMMRLSGFPLENFRWWIRFNQLWGALFPALGSEVYFQARFLPELSAPCRRNVRAPS
ncbi:MAG: class I SAM-dependent methyltransferase [Terriglobia bacterium]